MNDAPNFLVEWPSRWDEFWTAIGPALGKSPKRLAGEAQVGLFPWWGILLSWALELLLLVAVIVVPAKLASIRLQQSSQSTTNGSRIGAGRIART